MAFLLDFAVARSLRRAPEQIASLPLGENGRARRISRA
jgi:hypothetical protein